MAELHDAFRAAGARFGVYFSGALDWHVSGFLPIESDVDLFRHRRNDEWFARYSAAQLEELIAKFSPDVLWNEIDWPDGGKGHEDYAVAALLRRYFEAVPGGLVNALIARCSARSLRPSGRAVVRSEMAVGHRQGASGPNRVATSWRFPVRCTGEECGLWASSAGCKPNDGEQPQVPRQ